MAELTKEQKARMLKRMMAIRRFEESVKQLYGAGEIVGAIHLYIGQEAIAAGAGSSRHTGHFLASYDRQCCALFMKTACLSRRSEAPLSLPVVSGRIAVDCTSTGIERATDESI